MQGKTLRTGRVTVHTVKSQGRKGKPPPEVKKRYKTLKKLWTLNCILYSKVQMPTRVQIYSGMTITKITYVANYLVSLTSHQQAVYFFYSVHIQWRFSSVLCLLSQNSMQSDADSIETFTQSLKLKIFFRTLQFSCESVV